MASSVNRLAGKTRVEASSSGIHADLTENEANNVETILNKGNLTQTDINLISNHDKEAKKHATNAVKQRVITVMTAVETAKKTGHTFDEKAKQISIDMDVLTNEKEAALVQKSERIKRFTADLHAKYLILISKAELADEMLVQLGRLSSLDIDKSDLITVFEAMETQAGAVFERKDQIKELFEEIVKLKEEIEQALLENKVSEAERKRQEAQAAAEEALKRKQEAQEATAAAQEAQRLAKEAARLARQDADNQRAQAEAARTEAEAAKKAQEAAESLTAAAQAAREAEERAKMAAEVAKEAADEAARQARAAAAEAKKNKDDYEKAAKAAQAARVAALLKTEEEEAKALTAEQRRNAARAEANAAKKFTVIQRIANARKARAKKFLHLIESGKNDVGKNVAQIKIARNQVETLLNRSLTNIDSIRNGNAAHIELMKDSISSEIGARAIRELAKKSLRAAKSEVKRVNRDYNSLAKSTGKRSSKTKRKVKNAISDKLLKRRLKLDEEFSERIRVAIDSMLQRSKDLNNSVNNHGKLAEKLFAEIQAIIERLKESIKVAKQLSSELTERNKAPNKGSDSGSSGSGSPSEGDGHRRVITRTRRGTSQNPKPPSAISEFTSTTRKKESPVGRIRRRR